MKTMEEQEAQLKADFDHAHEAVRRLMRYASEHPDEMSKKDMIQSVKSQLGELEDDVLRVVKTPVQQP